MILLAYDTSSAVLSVAVFKDGKKLGGAVSETGAKHSSVLLPMIEKVLKSSRVRLDSVDLLAVGLGPGSFTGLRVGIATAKVLGYVLKNKIVGVSSLEAMAREKMGQGPSRVAAMIDARKGQVYGAVYESRGGKLKTVLAPSLLSEAVFLTKARGAVLVRGDEVLPDASQIARAAFSIAAQKKFTDPYALQPLYLHAKDCNVTYAKK